MPLYATSDQDVLGLGINLSDLEPTNLLIKTKKKRKKTGAVKRCILLLLSVKRPLIFWTRRLHLDVLQSLSHKRINYQTTVTDDSC